MNSDAIAQFVKELKDAESVNIDSLAKAIRDTGFECKLCAECCKGSYGDNTVAVFPFEIRRLMQGTGLDMFDIVCPAYSEDTDEDGNIHTFEWVLRKKDNGDCIFLNACGKCEVYDHRPFICRTYPMRYECGKLETYECKGIGTGKISRDVSISMAKTLKERYVTELKETISLLEKLDEISISHNKGNVESFIVHDSEGAHKFIRDNDGNLRSP